LPGVPRHFTAIDLDDQRDSIAANLSRVGHLADTTLGGVMFRFSFNFAMRAVILPLVLLALSFASQNASAVEAPAYTAAGTDNKFHSQYRALETGKAVADARAAMVPGACDESAYLAAQAKLGLKMVTLEEWWKTGLAAVMLQPSGIQLSSFARAPAH